MTFFSHCFHPFVSMTQVQCCHSQLEKQYCSDGIEFANVRDECDSHIGENSTCEAEYFKVRH